MIPLTAALALNIVKKIMIWINNFFKDLDYSNGLSTQSYSSTDDFCQMGFRSVNI